MIRGLYIQNPVVRPNGDGIDIDSCDNVTVSDCTIFSGDDGITLRGDNKLLKDKSKACENVTITNCILSTPCNAIRVGVGDGIIKNCIFSNIIVKNTRTGICIISKYSQQQQSGTTIRNIKFSNFIMETIAPFYIASGEGGTASLENIYFSDMRISGERTSLLLGNAANILNSISFKNIEIELSAGSKYMSDEQITAFTREWDKGGNMAFYCVNCNKIKFTDLQVCWSNIDVPWKYALVLERVKNIRISNLDAFPPCSQGENVKKINSENIYISNIFNTKK
jgi:parallel beta-helix repeat protein